MRWFACSLKSNMEIVLKTLLVLIPGFYWVNAMVADALAPCVTRTSATMVLTMKDKCVHVIHKEGFQVPAASQWWEMIENANIFYVFLTHCGLVHGSHRFWWIKTKDFSRTFPGSNLTRTFMVNFTMQIYQIHHIYVVTFCFLAFGTSHLT